MIRKMIILCSLSIAISACVSSSGLSGDESKRAAAINAQLGVGYLRQGKYEIAKQKLDKALEQDPDNGNIHHYMAELYRRLNEPTLAEKHFQIAMNQNEDDFALLNNYAVFLCGNKEYKKATEYFDKVLTDPVYQRKDLVYENMGLCSKSQGNLFLAEKHFDKALGMNSKLPITIINLAQISFDKQQIAQANFHYKRYLKIARQTAQSLWLGYLLEKQNGNANMAGRYAILLKGKFPDSKEARLLRKLESQ